VGKDRRGHDNKRPLQCQCLCHPAHGYHRPPPTFYRTRDDIIHRTCTYSTPTGPPQSKCKTRPTHLQLVPDQCDHNTTTTTIQHYPMPVLNTYCNTEPNHPAATQTCHCQTRMKGI